MLDRTSGKQEGYTPTDGYPLMGTLLYMNTRYFSKNGKNRHERWRAFRFRCPALDHGESGSFIRIPHTRNFASYSAAGSCGKAVTKTCDGMVYKPTGISRRSTVGAYDGSTSTG